MSLRLKIQTVPPNLPALRVWFVPTGVPLSPSSSSFNPPCFDPLSSSSAHAPPQQTHPFTVHALKAALCTQLPEFKDSSVKPRELGLYVDEFEIMDGTEVRGVVRDGDVVCVKRRISPGSSASVGGKGKGEEAKKGKGNEKGGEKKEKNTKDKQVKEEEKSEGRGTKRKRAGSDAAVDTKAARSTGAKGKEKAKDKDEEKEKEKSKAKDKVKGIKLRKTTKRPGADSDSDTDSSSSSSSSASSSSSSSSKSSSSSGFSSSSASSSSSSSSASSVSSSSSSSSSDSESDSEGRKGERKGGEAPVPLKIRKTSTESKGSKSEAAPPMTIAIRPNARSQHPVPSVPPGMGKPTTHARNERRRKRRVAEKNALALGTSFAGSSAANAVPLGSGFEGRGLKAESRQSEEDLEDLDGEDAGVEGDGDGEGGREENQEDRIIMASLRNKNKKKGFFRQGMMRGLEGGRAKIVFGEDGGEARDAMDVDANPAGDAYADGEDEDGEEGRRAGEAKTKPTTTTNHHRERARLVPPSELQDMGRVPANLFVTSVDVEEGMWGEGSGTKRAKGAHGNGANTKGAGSEGKKNRGKKGKGKARDYEEGGWDDEWYGGEEPGRFEDAEEEIVLDYGEGDNGGGGGCGEEKRKAEAVNWVKAEVGWNNFPVVGEKGQVEVGGVVGWKSLGLNPATLTPEVMLCLARVISKGDDALTIRHIERPDAHEAAFSFGVASRKEEGAMEEEGEEEVVIWDAVFVLGEADKWRVVGV